MFQDCDGSINVSNFVEVFGRCEFPAAVRWVCETVMPIFSGLKSCSRWWLMEENDITDGGGWFSLWCSKVAMVMACGSAKNW